MALYELTSGKDFVKLGNKVISKYEEVPMNPFAFEDWLYTNMPERYEYGTTDPIKPRGINKKLCEMFGSKITLRLNAALYNTFIKANFPIEVYFFLRHEGRYWRNFSAPDVNHAIANKHLIDQAVKDRTINLIPLMLHYEEDTQQLRKRFGKGLWRQLAHTSKTRMKYLAPLLKENTEFVTVRTGVLKQVVLWDDVMTPLTAAKVTPRVVDFERTESMIKDTLTMAQRNRSEVNYDWSYRRWQEEHEFLTREINKSRFSDKKFTEDCVFTQSGYTFTLLTSQLDIATEGKTMHHCVSSYAHRASQGKYAVFKVDGRERATLGLNIYPTGGALDQCYGYCNQAISAELRSMLPRIVRMYDDTIRLRDGRTA